MSSFYTHLQTVPSQAWSITHNFNGAPTCDVIVDIGGGAFAKILPLSVKHVSANQLLIEFSEPTTGRARLVGQFVVTATSGAGSIDPGQ